MSQRAIETPADGSVTYPKFASGLVDTDLSAVSGSDDTIASAKAIKTYVDTQIGSNNELSEVLANGNTSGGTNIVVSAGDSITTDTIAETTAAAGVTIDGVLVKDNQVDGRDVSVDGTKLDTVETNADVTDTANVTAAGALMDSELTNITAVKALDQGVATTDTPTFAGVITAGNVDGRDVSVDGAKLDGIEAGADVTDTTNVTAAGALMDSELTNITAVKALDQGVATTDSPSFAGLTATTADINGGTIDGVTALSVATNTATTHTRPLITNNGGDAYNADIQYTTTNRQWIMGAFDTAAGFSNGAAAIYDATAAAYRMVINNSGRMGLNGITTVSHSLHVKQASDSPTADGIAIEASGSTNRHVILMGTDGHTYNYAEAGKSHRFSSGRSSAVHTLDLVPATSGVNYISITGSATGANNSNNISAAGSDSNIGIGLGPKGTGNVGIASGISASFNASRKLQVQSDSASKSQIGIQALGATGAERAAIDFFAANGTALAAIGHLSSVGNPMSYSAAASHDFLTGSGSFGGGDRQFKISHVASAVNYWDVSGNITTGGIRLKTLGSDANVDGFLNTKGTGKWYFNHGSDSQRSLELTAPASAVNYAQIAGNTTGNHPAITASGSDANLNLNLQGKGSGGVTLLSGAGAVKVQVNGTGVGFHAASPIAKPTVTGSRGSNAALASLLTALASYGLITDSSS